MLGNFIQYPRRHFGLAVRGQLVCVYMDKVGWEECTCTFRRPSIVILEKGCADVLKPKIFVYV